MKCLMLGCGFTPPVRVLRLSEPTEHIEWTTLDANPDCKPDVVFDLEQLNGRGSVLPFPPNSFDEIHAYHVMEHFGQQGDFRGFFHTMRAFWLALKPGGLFLGESPSPTSMWLWGDPGHTRAINKGTFVYLTRELYGSLASTTASDYRRYVEPYWWDLLVSEYHTTPTADNYRFILRKS